MSDEDLSGVGISVRDENGGLIGMNSKKGVDELRQKFVSTCINELDMMFGRALGCRLHPTLKEFVQPDNHLHPLCGKKKRNGFLCKAVHADKQCTGK